MWMASTTAGTGDIRVNTSPPLRSTRGGRQPASYTGCAVTTIPVTRSEKTGGSACLPFFSARTHRADISTRDAPPASPKCRRRIIICWPL